jgi:hypothetical protein
VALSSNTGARSPRLPQTHSQRLWADRGCHDRWHRRPPLRGHATAPAATRPSTPNAAGSEPRHSFPCSLSIQTSARVSNLAGYAGVGFSTSREPRNRGVHVTRRKSATASVRRCTIGSPRRLRLVLRTTGMPAAGAAAAGTAARLVTLERHRPPVRQQHHRQVGWGSVTGSLFPRCSGWADCPYGRQRPARSGRQGGAFLLRQPTPNAVPFAVLDRVGGTLADHRASAADCLRACFSGVPLGRAFPIGRKEHCAIDIAAGSPQPPRPQRRCSCVLKRFLPSVHLLPRNDDHAGASAPRSEASTRQWMSQHTALWAGALLKRPGGVWVPGASIPGDADRSTGSYIG